MSRRPNTIECPDCHGEVLRVLVNTGGRDACLQDLDPEHHPMGCIAGVPGKPEVVERRRVGVSVPVKESYPVGREIPMAPGPYHRWHRCEEHPNGPRCGLCGGRMHRELAIRENWATCPSCVPALPAQSARGRRAA